MSDSELEDLLQSSDDLAHKLDLQEVDDLLGELQKEQAIAPLPKVKWKKTESDGNLIRIPHSRRRQSKQGQYCFVHIKKIYSLYQIKENIKLFMYYGLHDMRMCDTIVQYCDEI